ncbi:MAG: hypothetical protein Fur0037_28500 [Planctomycetota bacterium]
MNRTGPLEPREATRASWGLLGFYTGCAGVAIGAAIGACGFAWFDSVAALAIGVAMVAGSTAACLIGLRHARR